MSDSQSEPTNRDVKVDWRLFFGRVYIESTIRTEPNGDIVMGGRSRTYDYYGNLESTAEWDSCRCTFDAN